MTGKTLIAIRSNSVESIHCHFDVKNLYEVFSLFVGFVADTDFGCVFVENRRFLASFTLAVPVQNKLQGNEFLSRLSLKLAHSVLLAHSALVGTNNRVIYFNVAALSRHILVLLDDGHIVLPGGGISLVIESHLS